MPVADKQAGSQTVPSGHFQHLSVDTAAKTNCAETLNPATLSFAPGGRNQMDQEGCRGRRERCVGCRTQSTWQLETAAVQCLCARVVMFLLRYAVGALSHSFR
jgi:hypothetical protein